ncbi:MAG: ATP-binding domain-containing protein [Flavobacterium sp.]
MEKIEDIAKSIKRHRDLEISVGATNNAVGRSMTLYNNEKQQFWLINKQATVFQFQRDLHGNVIPETGFSEVTTYKGDGFPVPRDSKLGGLLIQFHEGKHKHQTPQGEITIEIFNRASYYPSIYNGECATDILIKISGDSKTHSFKHLSKILSLQFEIEKEKENLEHATDQEAQQLIQRIADKVAEMNTYLDKAQGFIRKHAELRYQPILDPIQEAIKRSKIFDGSLIINGGPGTGKTTSLIQRIKFLISPSIEEYITLDQKQKDILFNQKTSWIFYSPNELLALFLRNSMKIEELTADSERVKVWSSHKIELVKAYKLVDTTTKRPFLIYNRSQGKSLFVNKPKNIQEIVSGLKNFYLDFQKDKLNKVLEIDVSQFNWKNTGLSIQKYLNDKKNVKNIDELIRLFLNLNETYKTESDAIAEEYSILTKQVAGRIQVIITNDSARTTALADILNQWKNSSQETEEDDDDDATEIELEDFEEKEEQASFDFERELFNKLKSLCRKQALKKFDKNTKFSKRDRELLTLIPEVNQQNEYEKIGQTAFFKKFFERIIKGVLSNILREIPMTYKKHRREQLTAKNKNWDLQILDELVKKDKNSRIHSDEQALLIHFTNEVCYNLSKGFQRQFNTINHPYLNAFKSNCKPVIAIDEATDFSIIDLLAINSFRHPQLSSVTLSGDIMQRMTNKGLTSWEDFSSVVKGTERKDLEISYRQSPTLLSLALSIYEKSTGKKANYKSYIEKDVAEPKPLILVSDNEDEKLNWISERIIEIYKAYGDSVPSIAVFLPNENQLEGFANKLGNIDTLSDVGIFVKACRNGEVLGDKNTIRIFSIDKIKGLEFEAVFFHNLDELQNQNLSSDLLLKYLYVGLSRATFYLGLTVTEELNSSMNFLSDRFDKNGTWRN